MARAAKIRTADTGKQTGRTAGKGKTAESDATSAQLLARLNELSRSDRQRALPDGAVSWSHTFKDRRGKPRAAKDGNLVPVDEQGYLTAHLRYRCRRRDGGEPCGYDQWVSPGDRPQFCPVHGKRLKVEKRGEPILPWPQIKQAVEPQLRPVWLTAAEIGCAIALHQHEVPSWEVLAATPALAAVAYGATRYHLTRRAIKHNRIDKGQTSGRQIDKIRRRSRIAGYGRLLAGAWSACASATDPATTVGKIVWSMFPVLLLSCVPYWLYLKEMRERYVPAFDGPFDPEEAIEIWRGRVAQPGGVLAGTTLVDPKPIKGGWSGVIKSDVPGSIDPDRFRRAGGRVAGSFEIDQQDVEIEPFAGNASKATIRVYRVHPLAGVLGWPGPQKTWHWQRGVSEIGRYSDDKPAFYRWWNEGGPWHDLISGATNSGKSELVKTLILHELHSDGLILSRVIDQQLGQTYGDLQDHVDWFAPNIAEARYLLLDSVKEMYRRNRVFSRRRQTNWKATREFPLIVVTIDEAQDVLKDPICLALVEKLANMARKCGIKLRIITQVPLLAQIGSSTPIKDALLAGQVIVFRTGSPISGQVAFNGALPVEPSKLPRVWPDGTPAAGTTTAGLCYLLGEQARSTALRTFYTGELGPWLVDTRPAYPSREHIEESGPLWGKRRERVLAILDAPVETADILPGGYADILIAQADGKKPAPAVVAAGGEPDDDDAKSVVLRAAVAAAKADGRFLRRDIVNACINPTTGKPYSSKSISTALIALDAELLVVKVNKDVNDGVYQVEDKGRARVSSDYAEARELVDELAPEPQPEPV